MEANLNDNDPLSLKNVGNGLFSERDFEGAIEYYSMAIDNIKMSQVSEETDENCDNLSQTTYNNEQEQEKTSQEENTREIAPNKEIPQEYRALASVCFANRAACFFEQEQYENVVDDCTEAISLDPHYVKAFLRRGKAREILDKPREAFDDFTEVLKYCPDNKDALLAIQRLPPIIQEKEQRQKEEMMGQLKDLGNNVLGLFGMSLDNFKVSQEPTGNYSVQFQNSQQQ